ncbi:MAG TPA: LCP family protein [Acidimicrobiia bacterium]|nr:LCP family protein [Acidimicrobiia bacterium]
MSRHSSPPRSRSRRGLPRWLKVTVLSLLIVANLAAAGVWWTLRSTEQAFRTNADLLEDVVPELASRPTASSEPLYFLVIGSDSREGVDVSDFGDFAGARGDVVMISRLDRETGRGQILSIPRDTLVPIEGHGEDKINAAYAYGGAPLMVKTVRSAFDVPIHHYVEIDFVGFQSLVDELGGVEMTFTNAARDAKSHLDVPAGSVTLDGYQALAYARSRSYQELQGDSWRSVDANDLGRTERQQALVMAILGRLKRPSTLTEAGDIVASIAQHMTVDASLADSSLIELAFSLRGLDATDLETATIPTVGETRNGASVQVLDQPAADAMLVSFRTGDPLEEEALEAIVAVDVLNGNGVTGSASQWAARLREVGYRVNQVDDAGERRDTTVVVVEADRADAAPDLIADLGFGNVEVGAVPRGVDAVVILGEDAGQPVS